MVSIHAKTFNFPMSILLQYCNITHTKIESFNDHMLDQDKCNMFNYELISKYPQTCSIS